MGVMTSEHSVRHDRLWVSFELPRFREHAVVVFAHDTRSTTYLLVYTRAFAYNARYLY